MTNIAIGVAIVPIIEGLEKRVVISKTSLFLNCDTRYNGSLAIRMNIMGQFAANEP